MMENQIRQIESAKNLQECMNVLKNGNDVLKKMQDSIKIEEWEKIKDDMDELKEKDKEVSDFLKGYGINEDEYNKEVEDDLNKLINEVEGNINLPEVPKEENSIKIFTSYLTSLTSIFVYSILILILI